MKVVSTTDFFYPLVNDPYLQGRIGAANVLSDMYALGVCDIDNCLMVLAASLRMDEEHRRRVTAEMIRGFYDCCRLASTVVSGGQSVLNPWPIIGGVAQSTVMDQDMIPPYQAQPGDVVVLTKPLGTQVAVNVEEWRQSGESKWLDKFLPSVIDEKQCDIAFNIAVGSMIRLNRRAAALMHKYHAHCATDVTGFGILGHARNLMEFQPMRKQRLTMVLHTLPVIAGMARVNRAVGNLFKLEQGLSAETSGGLLVCLSDLKTAESFIKELESMEGWPAYVVGRVEGSPITEDLKSGDDEGFLHTARMLTEEEGLKIVEVGPEWRG